MSPTSLFGVQFTLSFILASIVGKWYVAPALGRLPVKAALVPLFLVHVLRYLPSTAFAPGQVDADIPAYAMAAISYGDMASAVLALIAALLLRYSTRGAIAVAWLVNTVTSLDWLHASFLAVSNHLATYRMGGNWYIMAYYVPVIGVAHVMIFARLVRHSRQAKEAGSRTAPA